MENKKKMVSVLTALVSSFAMFGSLSANAELMRDTAIYTPEGKSPIYVTDSVPFETPFYVDGVEHTANLYFGFKNDAVNPKDGYLEVHTETVFIFEFKEDIPVTTDTKLDFGKISVMDKRVKDETIDNHLYLDFTKDANVFAEPCDVYDGNYAIPEYTGDSIHKGDTMMVSVETGTDKSYYYFYDSFEYLFVGGKTYCKAFTGNRSIGETVCEVSENATTVYGQHCYTGHEALVAKMNLLTLPARVPAPTEQVTESATEETTIPEATVPETEPSTQPETAIEIILIPTQASTVAGDADGDGVLDIIDVTSINKALLGLSSVKRPDLADINHNGVLDSDDQLIVMKLVLNIKN